LVKGKRPETVAAHLNRRYEAMEERLESLGAGVIRDEEDD
jgi:hypothetical protein